MGRRLGSSIRRNFHVCAFPFFLFSAGLVFTFGLQIQSSGHLAVASWRTPRAANFWPVSLSLCRSIGSPQTRYAQYPRNVLWLQYLGLKYYFMVLVRSPQSYSDNSMCRPIGTGCHLRRRFNLTSKKDWIQCTCWISCEPWYASHTFAPDTFWNIPLLQCLYYRFCGCIEVTMIREPASFLDMLPPAWAWPSRNSLEDDRWFVMLPSNYNVSRSNTPCFLALKQCFSSDGRKFHW
jgi:hypothetical protein